MNDSVKSLLNDIPDSEMRSELGLMIALGSAFDSRFLGGLERVMDGKCPDCGEPIETHKDEQRCFRPDLDQQERGVLPEE